MGFIHDRLDMSGHVAIVTGGGRNLGRGVALGLADAGAAVVIAEIDEETGPAMERELR
ncbi:MAG: dehydrogenase, partial [Chloroflexi bacterium]|nr:dehydrogenase [Chloroflexota bacterium]